MFVIASEIPDAVDGEYLSAIDFPTGERISGEATLSLPLITANSITFALIDQSQPTVDDSRNGTGNIHVVTTFLEMFAQPGYAAGFRASEHLPENAAILHAKNITIAFYRFLFNKVGKEWGWFERKNMNDAELGAIIQNDNVKILVLYVDGSPAGYAELDFRTMPDVEIVYFGIMPEFIGHGLGGHLMRAAVAEAWSHNPRRLWLHTCTFDHPSALGFYRHAGFAVYKTEETVITTNP